MDTWIKRPGSQSEHLPPSNTRVWKYASTLIRFHGIHRYNFTCATVGSSLSVQYRIPVSRRIVLAVDTLVLDSTVSQFIVAVGAAWDLTSEVAWVCYWRLVEHGEAQRPREVLCCWDGGQASVLLCVLLVLAMLFVQRRKLVISEYCIGKLWNEAVDGAVKVIVRRMAAWRLVVSFTLRPLFSLESPL
jgi:hypothetical protein